MSDRATVIEVRGLHKSFGGTRAVRGVDLEIREGEIFGVVGPNGSGKTTTVECVTGLQRPDQGRVRVLGLDPERDRALVRRLVGVQLQQSQLSERVTVREALRLFATFYADPADPEELMDTFGLREKADQQFTKLSGGQKQRLSIALALVGNPRVVVLDELSTGLDPAARRDTWAAVAALRERGVTAVLVTHFMDEAEYLCDRVAVLVGGSVVALDTPEALVASVSTTRVRFRARNTDVGALRELPGVREATAEGDALDLTGTGANLAFTVSAELGRQGITPAEFTVHNSGLEDVMLALRTHNQDREART
ncbi:ABC transporter ATP-binding protein [Nocardiopsis metallicus]|uniref:ABC-2 type transport system ATP-binding protein n=1 Tax=Nocardiopsis metallicus TaxID=179819 RepID=A0A840W7C6_9ACTN|nr:ABC transporter ATP-binding protein [Nocardiopsis metallicus]MBB5492910.1 ABC-2 type transport system ATP-binding protein [Nocardiopsis metallicus]